MKKPTKKNPYTGIEQRLDRIIKLLEKSTQEDESPFIKEDEELQVKDSKTIKVIFPKMNLKEIFEQSKGKCVNGDPLVWNFKDSWLRDEKFFTEEYTSEGEKELNLEWIGVGKNWNECKKLAEDKGLRMLNMAELFYLTWKHPDVVKPLLDWNNDVRYTWTSSVTVDGFVAFAGGWCADGPLAGGNDAGREWGNLGLVFSCRDL